jgi:hypothetical protein
MFLDEIREEEQFEDDEDDKQLDEDNSPQRASQRHGTKTINV